jgi:hypothetical protein
MPFSQPFHSRVEGTNGELENEKPEKPRKATAERRS